MSADSFTKPDTRETTLFIDTVIEPVVVSLLTQPGSQQMHVLQLYI